MAIPFETTDTFSKLPFWTKNEVFEPGFQTEWERVQEMRRLKHPLIRGGQWIETPKEPETVVIKG